ncbi:MAG TPA: protein kinase [Pirellulales bacterium]|nr:protein kinase [Pirellulales bacterium]
MQLSGQQVMEVFCAALSRQSPEDRAAFLAEACGDDAALRARIEDLLLADEEAGRFLEGAAGQVVEGPGTQIGPYKLLEQIGEGGFGIVFMAEQTCPVRRRVALKIVKPGMDSRQVVARFEAERQALALMEHPNIARVLDAGQTESGRPYFVMELVRGTPITEFCDHSRLSPKERLELFLSVCQAVQHAHSKGIIHRDLKPSNVLVTMHDETPVVKVIDFGIAKALGEPLTEKTYFTGFAQMLGTPRYMSPEQSQKNGLDIDTRTDIYALGVVLYELLTGSTPLEEERLRQAGFDEIGRLIREEESPPPSTRIALLGESATVVSADRGSDPVRLRQLIRGELDWIVLKALEKDRNRRYETASAFAADVRRYLADEPVLACPPSRRYRFGKFARRNKLALTAAALIVLGAAITIAELAASNSLIRREQARTQEAKDRAVQAEELAEQRAEQIRHDLNNLTSANALLERGRWYASQRRWDDAHAAFSKAIELRPDHASLWAERGDLLALLGLWDLAAADLAREVQLREPNVAFRYYLHALLRLHVGDAAGHRQARVQIRERFGGTTNTTFARELTRAFVLWPGPEGDPTEVVRLAETLLADSPGSRHCLFLLGVAHYRAGQFEQAVGRLRESLDAKPDFAVREIAYPVLAMAHYRLGQSDDARQALHATVQTIDRWTQDRYESQSGAWVTHRGAEAAWPIAWCDWLECDLYYREAANLIDGESPPDDPRLAVLRARAFAGLHWDVKASAEYAAALNERPGDAQIRLESHRSRGYVFLGQDRYSDAAAEFAAASNLAGDDADLWRFCAVAHLAAGEGDAYRRACQAMLDRFAATNDSRTACSVLFACVLADDAVPEAGRLVKLAEVAAPYFHYGGYVRGAALYRAGRWAEAIECFRVAAILYRPSAWDWSFLAMAQYRLGQIDDARRSLAEADRWVEEADRNESDDLANRRAAWGTWAERAVYPLLVEEARKMIE